MITLRIPALVISCLAAVAVSASGFVIPQASLLYNAKSAHMLLQKQQKRYALVTMCIGVGQGYATIIERA